MRYFVNAVIAIAVITSPALAATIFEDHFDSNSLTDYSQACYPTTTGSATWQILDGSLRGTSTGGVGQCYALIGDPSWQITSVSARIRGVAGIDKGINIHNTIGHLGINLRCAPYNDIMVTNGHAGDFTVVTLPHSNGEWLDLEVRIVGTDMQVLVNGILRETRQIAADVLAMPFNDARLWVYNGTVTDYDDIRIEGAGVVATQDATWGALKATYR